MPQTFYATPLGERVKFDGQMVMVDCVSCGIPFALPAEYDANRRRLKDSWHCPNGHSQSYTGKTEAEKLREQLDREREALTSTQDLLNAERSSHAATKGLLTKAKNRADAGVCQHCNRTFANVQRHMENKHKDA